MNNNRRLKYRKTLLIFKMLTALSKVVYAKEEQTICFSKNNNINTYVAFGGLKKNRKLCGKNCNGKTLSEIDIKNWKVVKIISVLDDSFCIIFTKKD